MRENPYFCILIGDMRKLTLILMAAAAMFSACKPKTFQPRPTIPLVENVASDTSGLAAIVARAGNAGADGSVAIIGEPADCITLARLFQYTDVRDNIDGRAVRDSLPDFAGERLDIILDSWNAPYRHFQDPDSLREATVRGALFAWDSTCRKSTTDAAVKLLKPRAKILVFSSPLSASFGLFDVDTLQQLCGGRSKVFTPVRTTIEDALENGAANIAVWASRDIRESNAYESVFGEMQASGSITGITPESALDIRTSFRSLLRQYKATGKSLDALILSEYGVDTKPLLSEIALIRGAGTEEDLAFSKMLSDGFVIIEPGASLADAVFSYMRKENLFTHNIARPAIRYYETAESAEGEPSIVEVGAYYVQQAYVQDFN